jgi:hypothetical protein
MSDIEFVRKIPRSPNAFDDYPTRRVFLCSGSCFRRALYCLLRTYISTDAVFVEGQVVDKIEDEEYKSINGAQWNLVLETRTLLLYSILEGEGARRKVESFLCGTC